MRVVGYNPGYDFPESGNPLTLDVVEGLGFQERTKEAFSVEFFWVILLTSKNEFHIISVSLFMFCRRIFGSSGVSQLQSI